MDRILKDPRKVFSTVLLQLGFENSKILSVSCDSASGSGMKDFIHEFPDRYVEIGISEQNAMGVCAGLAESGFIPIVSAIAPFISMRCYEQIRNDVGYANMNVKIIGSSSGLSHSTLGSSHQALEDIGLMRSVPNMTIINPGDAYEVEMALRVAVEHYGPVYIRMPRHAVEDIQDPFNRSFKLGVAEELEDGKDIMLIATGMMVREAQRASVLLKARGLNAGVINVHTIKPMDRKIIENACKSCKALFTIEEHSVTGGLGSAVVEAAADISKDVPIHIMGIGEGACNIGPYRELLDSYVLTAEKLADKVYTIYMRQPAANKNNL